MKNWKLYAMIIMAGAAFTACDDDEEITRPGGTIAIRNESSGVLILNNGNAESQIDGDFSVIEYFSNDCATGLFESANERTLGATPNRAIVYGSKIYAAVTGSNTIEIASRSDLKSVKQIQLAGNEEIDKPRDVIGKGAYVYVSLYSGHVARIDTATLSIDKTVAVGAYPEDMTIAGDYLYVPNSEYGMGTTVSQISLATFTKTKDITVPVNPVQTVSDARGNVYVRTSGWYDAEDGYKQKGAAVYKLDLNGGEPVKVADATLISLPEGSNVLYAVNYPYGANEITYFKVNLAAEDGAYTPVPLSISADAPAAIGVDPVNGNIVLTSYELDKGYASYSTPGYANMYTNDGTFIKKFDVGVGPCNVSFFTGKKTVIL